MKHNPASRSVRLTLELLHTRLQPGSVLSSGTNLSLVSLALGLNLVPDLSNLETPAPVLSVGASAMRGPDWATPLERTPAPGQPPEDAFAPAEPIAQVTSATPDTQVIPDLPPPGHNYPRTLWYNGDYDGRASLSSEMNTSIGDARTYDDFNVSSHHGWDLTHVWGNFQIYSNVASANFEIRSGITSGSGGTLVASGANLPATLAVHQTGRYLDITVDIALSTPIHLDQGTYWLTVQPVGYGTGRAYVDTTSGANSVRTPGGNNGNSFFDSHTYPLTFVPTTLPPLLGSGTWDFSYGVGGTVTRP